MRWIPIALGVLAACSGKGGTTASAGSVGMATSVATGVSSGTGSTGVASTHGTVGTSGATTGALSTGSGAGTGSVSTTAGTASSSTSGGGCGFQGVGCTLPDFGSGLCCGGTCIDPTSDDQNCSGCGLACPAGTQCGLGYGCVAPNCDGQPLGTRCTSNVGSVDANETCVNLSGGSGTCLAVTQSCNAPDQSCDLGPDGSDGGSGGTSGGGLCCGTTCTDFQNDPSNCGQCGLACPIDATCAEGTCSYDCNLGGCAAGLGCVPVGLYGGSACAPIACSGAPDDSACAFGADAGGAGGPGVGGSCCASACVDTPADPLNCGLCGHACGPDQYCASGSCVAAVDCTLQEFAGHGCGVASGGDGFCCGGRCQAIDVFTDPLNCGGCGRACPVNDSCVAQDCVGAGGEVDSCEEPGFTCPAGYSCGSYGCLLAACGAPDQFDPCSSTTDPVDLGSCCGAVCVDPLTDRDNCGQCGDACPQGTFCEAAACVPIAACDPQVDGASCPIGTGGASGGDGQCCHGACAPVLDDPSNCGGCGVLCPAGEACAAGQCLAPDGGYLCEPGGCPAGTLCDGKACLPESCPANEDGVACAFSSGGGSCCAGACVDLAADPLNCGACGTLCASGGCFAGTCLPVPSGSCSIDCGPDGLVCVDGHCLPGACTGAIGECAFEAQSTGVCCSEFSITGFSAVCQDILDDPLNCGGCGIACPAGQTCAQGACSGERAPCLAGSTGRYCDLDAGPNWLCCAGGGCTDLTADPNNCGSCGNACPAGTACFPENEGGAVPMGQCLATSCTAATAYLFCALDGGLEGICCGSSCANVGNDPDNCGDCYIACDAGQTCVDAACAP